MTPATGHRGQNSEIKAKRSDVVAIAIGDQVRAEEVNFCGKRAYSE